MLQLLADEFPKDMFEVFLWPLLLTMVGFAIFYAGIWLEARHRRTPWKWAALIPALIALFIGGGYWYRWVSDPIYADVVGMGAVKRMTFAHWFAFLVPLFGLAAALTYNTYKHKLNLNPDE